MPPDVTSIRPDLDDLEHLIAELEAEIRTLAPPAVAMSDELERTTNGCTHGCTYDSCPNTDDCTSNCTDNCTHGCTGTC